MAWRTAVKVHGEANYVHNALVFATQDEAEAYGRDLRSRWTLVESFKAEETSEPVNCEFKGDLVSL
jgi:hypothetical protein